ncbi:MULTISPECIES: polynucleotide adenylyltransferase PcnB [Methylomonas]|uniref:polynucleotide adenylyltransferase PcnB n=1 Tax=unclassified Methylomonas TaxID=2608980 RepID=UPI001E42FD6E|nr:MULTISPECIES: polynucleotide adenylyltransferase PcnB [Methylomonas]MDT4330588.1 polynucleotide adenylyltransferase PcnB [Methylomonas sp. MV1]WGS88565.1 polynucleotide adenylyltransferase PcnB [Methylomonas sp. UP202]
MYARAEHCISRAQISENALKVLLRLKKADFEAYLVGGCVRDLLLGREPKDFDVATNASPEQVKQIFRNCRIIGRRFRLAHVFFGREIIEVATFRGSEAEAPDQQVVHEDGRLLRDNVFGTLEEDVWRRDFTVNALYYNIRDFSVVDFTGGMSDHSAGVLKLIGDPQQRYREDPVRMLRAVRFAVKLSFSLHPDTEQPIYELTDLLKSIPSARLYDEVLKLFLAGYGVQTFEMLRHYGLFAILFPDTDRCLASQEQDFPRLFVIRALENSDARFNDGKTLTPYFLLAALLWEPLTVSAQQRIDHGENETLAYQNAANEVLGRQVKITAMPRHITQSIRDVWFLQQKFTRTVGSRPFRLLEQPKFRAAYDFLQLRAETGGADPELVAWWTGFQEADEDERHRMTAPPKGGGKPRARKTGRYRSRSKQPNSQ